MAPGLRRPPPARRSAQVLHAAVTARRPAPPHPSPPIDPASLQPRANVRLRTYPLPDDHGRHRRRALDRGRAGARRPGPRGPRRAGLVAGRERARRRPRAPRTSPAEPAAGLRAAVAEGARPARRRLLPPAQRRGAAPGRRHLHARRRSSRRWSPGPRAARPRRAWSTRGPARGASRWPPGAASPGADRGRGAATRSRRSPAGPTSPRPASPAAPACWSATTAAPTSARSTGARSTSATRPTCATTRSRRAGRSGSRSRPGPTGSRPASSPACTCTSSSRPPPAPARATAAPSSPPRSGSTPTTAASCASCCSGPLGGEAIHVLEPTAVPFEDAAVTAAITCFAVDRPGGRAGSGCGGWTRSPTWGRSRAAARSRPTCCASPGAGRP